MKALSECLPEGTDRKFVKSLDGFLEENTQLFDIDSVLHVLCARRAARA